MTSGSSDGSASFVWSPQPGPQAEAIVCTWCPELFYGGAAGGGKTDFLLGDFLQDVPRYGPAWQGVLFRRTYPELERIIFRSVALYPQTGATWSASTRTWSWPNGATLRMRYLEAERDATRYQGHEYTWIGWDELTQWPTDYAYRILMARLRWPMPVPTKRVRAAANPGGPGHHWVKSRFIDPAPAGFEPTVDPVTRMRRMYIPARVADNQILLGSDPEYVDRLRGIGSEALVRAWLEGDWNVIAGAYFPEFALERHVLARARPPAQWARYIAMDWGSARPFAVLWVAVASDDHEVLAADGKRRLRIPRGALWVYRELYGMREGMPNEGLKLPASEVARRIAQACQAEEERGFNNVADPSMWKEDGGPSIFELMREAVPTLRLRPADNQRIPGWEQVRRRLVGEEGRPMLFVGADCPHLIRTLGALQHDTHRVEDVDTSGEDHAPDALRYACMARPYIAEVQAPPKGPKHGTFDWLVSLDQPTDTRSKYRP